MDEKSAQEKWEILKQAIQKILRRCNPDVSFEDLYQYAYFFVVFHYSEKLYSGIKQVITEHLQTTVRKDLQAAVTGNFLETLNGAWQDYTDSVHRIRDIVMYMDRVYVPKHKVESVYNLGLIIFRDEIIYYGTLGDMLRNVLLKTITAERSGKVIDRMGVKNACSMLIALGVDSRSVYEKEFEQPFLRASAEFYRAESQRLLAENNPCAYAEVVEKRIAEETARARLCFDAGTEAKILAVLHEELTSKQMGTAVEIGNSDVAEC